MHAKHEAGPTLRGRPLRDPHPRAELHYHTGSPINGVNGNCNGRASGAFSPDGRYAVYRYQVISSVPPMVDWSPDGEWLVAREANTGLDLIQVSTGLTIPLRGTARLTMPAWRR